MIEVIRQDLYAIGLIDEADAAAPKLAKYLEQLLRWNTVYNLTAIRDPEQMRIQHLADCIAIIPVLRKRYARGTPIRVLDVGSGGGLPGVILAILHPAWHVDCIDAVAKKAAFVRQVAGSLSLKGLKSIHSRVEALPPQGFKASDEGYDLITARAFSTLGAFVGKTQHVLKPHGHWLAMKGRLPDAEMLDLPVGVVVNAVDQVEVKDMNASRCIVWMSSKH